MPGNKNKAPGLSGPLKKGGKQAKEGVSELMRMLFAYARQEALDPVVVQLKSLGYGLGGALLLSLGTVLLAIGFLRALQTELGPTRGTAHPYGVTGALSGDWSWAPYMGATVICLAVAAWCALRILRSLRR